MEWNYVYAYINQKHLNSFWKRYWLFSFSEKISLQWENLVGNWHDIFLVFFLICAAFDSYRCPQNSVLQGNSLGWLTLMSPAFAVILICVLEWAATRSLEGSVPITLSSAWGTFLLFLLAVYSKEYLLYFLSIWYPHSFSCHGRGKQYPKILCLTRFVCSNLSILDIKKWCDSRNR